MFFSASAFCKKLTEVAEAVRCKISQTGDSAEGRTCEGREKRTEVSVASFDRYVTRAPNPGSMFWVGAAFLRSIGKLNSSSQQQSGPEQARSQ